MHTDEHYKSKFIIGFTLVVHLSFALFTGNNLRLIINSMPKDQQLFETPNDLEMDRSAILSDPDENLRSSIAHSKQSRED